MKKVIGTITQYTGEEHPSIKDYELRIIAVLRNGAKPDTDVDSPDYLITSDEQLNRAGGITEHDRIEVQPYSRRLKRFSFVSYDPLAVDLANYEELKMS